MAEKKSTMVESTYPLVIPKHWLVYLLKMLMNFMGSFRGSPIRGTSSLIKLNTKS